jgi:hypothetical protein
MIDVLIIGNEDEVVNAGMVGCLVQDGELVSLEMWLIVYAG